MDKEEISASKSSIESYINDISRHSVASRDEQVELFKRLENGDDSAYNELIERNLRLVVSIAKKYVKPGINAELEDLIAEGNLGLMKAIDKFDWRRGRALSTYATWWIKQSIMRYLTNRTRTIRKPAHVIDIDAKKRKFRTEYSKEFGENPTDDEIMAALGISEKMHDATEIGSQGTVSIHSLAYSGESGSTLEDYIPDDNDQSPFDFASSQELAGVVREALKLLTPKEEKIIRLRFGIVDQPDASELWPVLKQELKQIKRGTGMTDK